MLRLAPLEQKETCRAGHPADVQVDIRVDDQGQRLRSEPHIVGRKIIVDPETCFQELITETVLVLLWERPCLELIIVSSNLQGLLFLRDEIVESVWIKAIDSSTKVF